MCGKRGCQHRTVQSRTPTAQLSVRAASLQVLNTMHALVSSRRRPENEFSAPDTIVANEIAGRAARCAALGACGLPPPLRN